MKAKTHTAGMFAFIFLLSFTLMGCTSASPSLPSGGESSFSSAAAPYLMVRKFTMVAGQKIIFQPATIRKIMQYIDQAPKTPLEKQDETPPSIFSVSCPDINYQAILYRQNILYYFNRYYRVDNQFRKDLAALYQEAEVAPSPIMG